MALNPATAKGVMVDSTPPASITSASPRRMMCHASPMEWAPVAHAVTMERFGPLAPVWIATCPGARFAMAMGMKNGLTRRGPDSSSTLCWFSISGSPPSPAPMDTPTRSAASPLTSYPASSRAIRAVATAYWMNVSILRASRRGT